MGFIHDDGDVTDKMITFHFSQVTGPRDNVKKDIRAGVCAGCSASHRVLSLQFELVDGQCFGVLQLLNLLHLLVVASDLLVDDHLDATAEGRRMFILTFFSPHGTSVQCHWVDLNVLRGRLCDILHTEQRVGAVWTAKDAWSENYGQRVGRHAVVGLVFAHPETVHWMLVDFFFFL